MDVPYIVFILFLLLLSGLYWKNPKRTYFVIAIWVVLFFIGFRSRVVGGADSINYVRFFTGEQNFYNINDTRDLYKPQNKMFRFYKTFCSRITLVNTIQNVI